MPIVPENISELNFDDRDLFLDVRLVTIGLEDEFSRDENTGFANLLDFTGRPSFKTGFFREGVGFGITKVKISTNASLQPIVEIEFKDLYGKTVFGELNQAPEDGLDYAAIFQWPPPKFEFTFKGYLGKPVTWILNMKTTNTQYNSDDGSYTIKTTFVPNQWGMFADIPFLYLFAVKKLRTDLLGSDVDTESEKYQEYTESVIDLMYSGKKFEKAKQQRTKEYDKIINALELLKRDPIGGILNGTLKVGEEISSATPGRGDIEGFKKIKVTMPPDDIYKDKSDEEIITTLRALNNDFRAVENWRIKLANAEPNSSLLTSIKFAKQPSGEQKEKLRKDSKKIDTTIDENLELIDNAIKGSLYTQNQEEIKKLTISEVFSRIAKDTAFIMGYILDAGEQGYFNNLEARKAAEDKDEIIGVYYPMKFEDIRSENGESNVGKQVPADDPKLGTEQFEKRFISDFITAISAGIAENKALQAQAQQFGDNKIKHRVNNIELISENPFTDVSDWRQIASIIMKRAGLAGYLTQSDDPNTPGDYSKTGFFGDGRTDSPEEMRRFADGDVTNITDDVLAQLDVDALEKLKTFCKFWIGLIADPEGINITEDESFEDLNWRGGNADEGNLNRRIVYINPGIPELAENDAVKRAIEELRKIWTPEKMVFDAQTNRRLRESLTRAGLYKYSTNVIDLESSLGTQLKNAGFEAYSVEQYLEQFIGPKYMFHGRSTRQAIKKEPITRPTLYATSRFYDTISYMTYFNGLSFIHSRRQTAEGYEFLVFTDPEDLQAIADFQPAGNSSDAELQNQDEETQEENVDDGTPLGITFIDSSEVPESDEEPLGAQKENPNLTWFNELEYGSKLDYNWCKGQTNLPASNSLVSNSEKDAVGEAVTLLRREDIGGSPTKVFKQTLGPTSANADPDIDVDASQVATIVYAQTWNSTKPNPTGGLFGASTLAIGTRAFLRQYCKQLIGKIQKLQDETSQLFGQILGRAGEHEDLMYQQMHTLFHQWQILAAPEGKRLNTLNSPSVLTPNVALKLQDVYGNTISKQATPSADAINDGKDAGGGGGFRYDYPLQAIGNDEINVANAIVNIDALYNAKANTTVLNIFQQVCQKNNFMFFPIAGNARYNKISDIFEPVTTVRNPKIGNFFQILFQPTPESRTLVGSNNESQSVKRDLENFTVEAFPVVFGDPSNKIIKNVTVGTDDNKVTAESIVNLQRIVDNENKNRTVTTDCSLLSVFEGRSYTAKLETLGNAQLSPMQFFYLKNHTIFTGLYQIIKVEHDITPNDMTTNFEGIKMRWGGGKYGGVLPITLEDFEEAARIAKTAENETQAQDEISPTYEASSSGSGSGSGGGAGGASSGGTSSGGSGNYSVTGTDQGAKDVQAYLNNSKKKRIIDKIIAECRRKGITTDFAIAAILSIISKESGFDITSEGFNYSAQRLTEVFSSFKAKGVDKIVKEGFVNPSTKRADAEKYQKKIADFQYGGRYGNGKNEGWKYRGRGLNQVTFKSGYQAAKDRTGIDVVKYPDKMLEEDTAIKVTVAFFNARRKYENFGTTSTTPAYKYQPRTSRQEAYGLTDDGLTFPDLKNAVFAYYHYNAGPGYAVEYIKAKLSPDEKLGGMRRAQSRAPAFLEYVQKNKST
jgi:putative chitinase